MDVLGRRERSMAGMPGRDRGYICRWKMRAVLLTASKKNEAGYAGTENTA